MQSVSTLVRHQEGLIGGIFITSKDGTTVAAATVTSGFKLAIVPADIVDAQATYDALNVIIPIEHDTFFAKVH